MLFIEICLLLNSLNVTCFSKLLSCSICPILRQICKIPIVIQIINYIRSLFKQIIQLIVRALLNIAVLLIEAHIIAVHLIEIITIALPDFCRIRHMEACAMLHIKILHLRHRQQCFIKIVVKAVP